MNLTLLFYSYPFLAAGQSFHGDYSIRDALAGESASSTLEHLRSLDKCTKETCSARHS